MTESFWEAVTAVADKHKLAVARDTHYDALNAELYWWSGTTRHAIDLQPYPDGRLQILYLRTRYRFPSRLVAWAGDWLPMFSRRLPAERQVLAELEAPWSSDQVDALISSTLRTNR
ncbi:MAG: hypothetical protein ABW178_07625 [Pseudoxanthomonas sp.]